MGDIFIGGRMMNEVFTNEIKRLCKWCNPVIFGRFSDEIYRDYEEKRDKDLLELHSSIRYCQEKCSSKIEDEFFDKLNNIAKKIDDEKLKRYVGFFGTKCK